MIRAALLLVLVAAPASAERVIVALSQNRVQIDTAFTGSEILIYGAIAREAPAPTDTALGMVITLSGPDQPVTVRRKSRRLGIWVNADSVDIRAAPSFYAVAATGPLAQVLDQTEDRRYRISPGRALGSLMAAEGLDPDAFGSALIRIRERAGAFQTTDSRVALIDGTLFSTEIALPANLVEGVYVIRIYVTRDGIVQSRHVAGISVRKVGLERFLHGLANERPLVYGLMSLAIAIGAGWGASAAFRLVLRG